MNLISFFHIFSFILLFFSFFTIPSWLVALNESEPYDFHWILFFAVLFIVSLIGTLSTKLKRNLGDKEGLAIVGLSWFLIALIGALPYVFCDIFSHFSYSFFESMSGFTTTGATVLTDVNILPKSLLLWRSLTHWMGGIGVVLVTISILPDWGVSGTRLLSSEVTGPFKDKQTPQTAETAKKMWYLYTGLTFLGFIALRIGGMDSLSSLCHVMGAISTGGFSTENLSVGAYDSLYFECVIIFIMFLASINLFLSYKAIKERRLVFFKDTEFRIYFITVFFAIFLVSINLNGTVYSSIGESIRYASFQVISIVTTTGYGTANYDVWPFFSQAILFCLMFCGGCAGSTSGGIKFLRVFLFFKFALCQLRRSLWPHGVFFVRLASKVVHIQVLHKALGFVILSLFILVFSTLSLCFLEMPLWESISASVACLWNIGPGFGPVGPIGNYAHYPIWGKFILSFCMLLGRLEFYAVLVLLLPELWRK